METVNQRSKEQLCIEKVDVIMLEAKKEASELFKPYPKQVKIEMQNSIYDEMTVAKNLLNIEYSNYDKSLNIRETKSAKSQMLEHCLRTKEIYDNELNFNKDGYEAQRQRIIDQLLVLRKIEYLEKLKSELQISTIQPKIEKIKWLRGVSEFGYMILRLEEKGYIELPVGSTSEAAYEKLAKILFETFDVTKSWASFKDSLSHSRNKLGEVKRAKLEDFPEDFPHALQLGNLKKDNRK